ncbi:MAG TPA: FAD-dependent oxidoreductase [Beutenbergiaceae bacterium]|nr:FAD-dependent oxidoreductase [Beutenbergiaceae bacterium]
MVTVIIGAGLAGLRTAAELRERDESTKIVLIGAEHHPPYDRPPLSSSLLSQPDPVWLANDLSINWPDVADEVHLGVQATALHLGPTTTVVTDKLGAIPASRVIIATGSTPLNPWHTTTLTTLDDAHALRGMLSHGTRTVAIIGAGWIGVELAHELQPHHHVTLIEASSYPLGQHLGEAAAYIQPWFNSFDLRVRTMVTGVSHSGRQHVVHTPDADIHADVVITAIGVRPATHWLQGSGIELDEEGFIPVDAGGKVTTPTGEVWAVGDVTRQSHPFFGTVKGGHWFHALRDPQRVAASIAGEELPPLTAPEVFSDQGPSHIDVLGTLDGEETVLRGNTDETSWVLFHLSQGRLRGAVVANSPRDTSTIRRALGQSPPPQIPAEELTTLEQPLRKVFRRYRG